MKSLFRLDSPILNFLSRMYDIAYLNLLFVIGCIPIITIGTSAAALYYCMLKISRENDSSLTKMFFHSYFQNMKQGIKLTMIVSYVFPLLAQFENTIKNTVKNALIISLNNFSKTIIIVFLNSIPFVLFFLLPHVFLMSVPLWLLFGTAAIAYINARSFIKIFDKYI